jgi:tetratricopeptide (TPR) repeat protein
LQAYSLAEKTFRSQGDAAAIPFFKRALELDPNFAVAILDLGIMYCNLGEEELCARHLSKAYEVRDRVTERERFPVDSSYFMFVTGELEKAAQVFGEWKQLYPRNLTPYINLGVADSNLGLYEDALANDKDGLALRKDNSVVYRDLSFDYMNLNRLDEAKSVLSEARARKLDGSLLKNYYQLAFLQNDSSEMQRLISVVPGKSQTDSSVLAMQADTEAFRGRTREANELTGRAISAALLAGDMESAADAAVSQALREAEFGDLIGARKHAASALSRAKTRDVQIATALAFARAGDSYRAQAMSAALQKHFAHDTLLVSYWLPTIHAAIAIAQGKNANALTYLQEATHYELGGGVLPFSAGASMYPVYLRGEAYLRLKQWDKAAAEFKNIIDHRGLVWNFPLSSLAYLQLARSQANVDPVAARATYERLFDLWQNSDNPTFAQAKKEFARLQ